jgi:hypothetical protein
MINQEANRFGAPKAANLPFAGAPREKTVQDLVCSFIGALGAH